MEINESTLIAVNELTNTWKRRTFFLTVECQVINMGGMLELEDCHLEITIEIFNS